MALTLYRACAAALLLSACLSGCKEKSVVRLNAASEQTLTEVGTLRRAVTPPELPDVPDPRPIVNNMMILETPADRFMGGIPDELKPPLPANTPVSAGVPEGPPFVRLFEPPSGIDASPVMRQLEVLKDMKVIKEREIRGPQD